MLYFFDAMNVLYGSIICELCTPEKCPAMNVGPKYEYLWADQKRHGLVKLSAPDYIDHLMEWVQDQLDDNALFATSVGCPFPRNFFAIVQKIFARLFRVFGHIYYSHYERIVQLGEEANLNSSFKVGCLSLLIQVTTSCSVALLLFRPGAQTDERKRARTSG